MKLATLQTVKEVKPAENADTLEIIKFEHNDFQVVTKKGLHRFGEIVMYITHDTIVKRQKWNEFLFKKDTDEETRIRQTKIRGNPSMGLVIPISEIQHLINPISKWDINVKDYSKQLGVRKYKKPITINADIAGDFPKWITKPDEENLLFGNINLRDFIFQDLVITKKMDGTSFTAYKNKNGEFSVCSRNSRIKEGWNSYWKIADKYNLENELLEREFIQGELCGPKIQANPYKLDEQELFVFNIGEVTDSGTKYLDYYNMILRLETLGIPSVPFIDIINGNEDYLRNKLKEIANNVEYNGQVAEGIVVRLLKNIFASKYHYNFPSFKILNENYKH